MVHGSETNKEVGNTKTKDEILQKLQDIMREGNENAYRPSCGDRYFRAKHLEQEAKMLIESLTGEKWEFGL